MRSIVPDEPPFQPIPIEVRHLRLVTAIVDEGSLTRAGERLHLTQSALSHQLKQIEQSLGVQLFIRDRKRLVVTPAGQELIDRARRILADIAGLESELRERAAGRRGTLRLATHCYTCYEWLPPLLKRFRRSHPDVDVQIVADATDDPISALRRGEIDLAIVTSPFDGSNVHATPLFRDELLLVVPPNHRLAGRAHVTARDFAGEHLLLYSPPTENFFYRNYLAGSAAAPPEVTVIRLTEAVLSMVRASLGVTVAARWAVEHELRSGRLVGVRIGAGGFFREWSAAFRVPQHSLPTYFTSFVDLVSQAAGPVRFAGRDAMVS
jgi:LysR family transcriptional regulator for metE and metH